MIRQNQRFLSLLSMLTDAFLVFIAYPAAVYVRFEVLNGLLGLDMLGAPYLTLIGLYAAVFVFALGCTGLYSTHRARSLGSGTVLILALNAVGALGMMALLYVTHLMEFPRLAVLLFWLISSALVVGKRIALFAVARYCRRRGYNQKHVILVGSGPLAQQYAKSLADDPQLGFCLDGYLGAADAAGLGPCLGGYPDLAQVLQQRELDELVVALEPAETDRMGPILAAADKEGVRISIIPFYSEYIPAHPSIDVIGQSKLINLRATPLDNLGWAAVKRGMDIVGSLLLIVLSSPLMLIAAVGVKLSSPGPILFRQERVGKDKKPFMMLKFRSMRVTATETTGWTTDTDPRKTRFGSFIRKVSIDELPQFFNVLKGDMSLVGPRPEVPYHVDHFKEEIPLYLVRQQVRPGITGWAQVHGLRGNTSIEARVKYDIWYIENWTLGLDLYILFKTALGGWMNSEQVGGSAQKEHGDG